MQSERLSNTELTGLITGRSGTLRAPTLRRGKTLVVGYSDELYDELFG
jgi:arsenate reductase-like glutaredoxin family protein|tara:strand:+ start:564 stop:707 length:144 start_codon:yes stop_codon:yes gene_type:complete